MNYAQEIEEIEKETQLIFFTPLEQKLFTLAKKMQEEIDNRTSYYVEIIEEQLKRLTILLDLLEKFEWIPCSERLPEEHGWYLVCFENSEYRAVDHWTGGGFSYPDMIAWMPLPEPFKGEL